MSNRPLASQQIKDARTFYQNKKKCGLIRSGTPRFKKSFNILNFALLKTFSLPTDGSAPDYAPLSPLEAWFLIL
jgi:hypothetical protein